MTKAPDNTGENTGRREVLLVGLIALSAMSVRLLYLSQWAENPLFHMPMGDELSFHQTALALLGERSTSEVFLFQPLYSFFLTALYGLLGVDIGMVRTVQLLIGTGTCLIFYGLGRELGGPQDGRWLGRISALLVAFYGPLVFMEGTLLAPALIVPLAAGALWTLIRAVRRQRLWLLAPAGLMMGLSLMGRPNLGVLLPVAGVWLLVRPWSWTRRLIASGIAVVSLLAGLSPSWIHNALSGEGKLPVSSSAGINFFIGNNPQATGAFHIPSGLRFTGSTHKDFKTNMVALAEQAQGQKLSASEVSGYWFGRGFDFWRSQPGAAMKVSAKKLLLSLNHEEIPVHHPYMFAREVVGLLKALLGFTVILPFALVGLFLGERRTGRALLGFSACAYLLTLIAFFVADRFRIAMLPMLAPLAALGMLELYRRFRDRAVRPLALALALLVASVALTQIPMLPDWYHSRALARGYNNMGKAEGERGRLDRAEKYFRKAMQFAGSDPKSHARVNLGRVLEMQGDLPGAKRLYLEAVRLSPENRYPREHLARLAEQAGHLSEAIRWWEEVANLMANPDPARRQIARLKTLMNPESP